MTMDHRDLTETFRFEYEDDRQDEIWRKGFFRVSSKSFILLFFSTEKLTRLFLLKEVQPSQDRKMTTRHDLNDLITCFRYYDVFVQTRSRMTTRSSFLDRPANFSGPKTNFKIKTSWIVAQFLEHKPVNFALLTYSFIVLFSKLLNFDLECKHNNHKISFRALKVTGTFENQAPGRLSCFPAIMTLVHAQYFLEKISFS